LPFQKLRTRPVDDDTDFDAVQLSTVNQRIYSLRRSRRLSGRVKAKIATQEVYPVGMCGAEFGAFLRKQYDDYGRVIREANIKAE
jgi:tripartite-type tricarboxylate transporter receptor subunit TctC